MVRVCNAFKACLAYAVLISRFRQHAIPVLITSPPRFLPAGSCVNFKIPDAVFLPYVIIVIFLSLSILITCLCFQILRRAMAKSHPFNPQANAVAFWDMHIKPDMIVYRIRYIPCLFAKVIDAISGPRKYKLVLVLIVPSIAKYLCRTHRFARSKLIYTKLQTFQHGVWGTLTDWQAHFYVFPSRNQIARSGSESVAVCQDIGVVSRLCIRRIVPI